jgi:hypothetical protein
MKRIFLAIGLVALAAISGAMGPVVVSVALSNITGLGTNVATALGIAVGSAGSVVTNGGALGTPSSGVGTNLSGTAPNLTAGNVTAPNFKVTLTGGNQSITSGTITKVAFDTVVIDSGSFWSTANKNFLPTVSGTYEFCAQVGASGSTFALGNDVALFISKNGTNGSGGTALTSYQGTIPAGTSITQALFDCTITSMNGSTDTIEVDVAITATSPAVISNSNPQTYFFGYRIGP